MGKKGFFATLFLVILLIFLLFPSSTGKEIYLSPEKVVNLDNFSHDTVSKDIETVSFVLDDYFGFFNENLEISYMDKIDYKVSISDTSFINYSKIPQILDIQDADGQGRSIIETSGYPVIIGDKVAVLSDSFVSLYDLDGNLYWKKDILSIITSITMIENSVLISYLDGMCELISISGTNELVFRPGGSRIEAVYSAAVSSDGQFISLISGLDPQRFILLQNRKGEYKPVYHVELEHEFRRSVNMYFSQDDSMVFFENNHGVNIFDINLKTITPSVGTGILEKIYKDNEMGLYSLLLSGKSGGSLHILTSENLSVLDMDIGGDSLFFKKKDNRYYIGSDNLLMFFKLVNR